MEATEDKYFTCPNCGWAITFHFIEGKYTALCPYCEERLDIDKEEYEAGDDEIYFEKDF